LFLPSNKGANLQQNGQTCKMLFSCQAAHGYDVFQRSGT